MGRLISRTAGQENILLTAQTSFAQFVSPITLSRTQKLKSPVTFYFFASSKTFATMKIYRIGAIFIISKTNVNLHDAMQSLPKVYQPSVTALPLPQQIADVEDKRLSSFFIVNDGIKVTNVKVNAKNYAQNFLTMNSSIPSARLSIFKSTTTRMMNLRLRKRF